MSLLTDSFQLLYWSYTIIYIFSYVIGLLQVWSFPNVKEMGWCGIKV